MNIMQELPKFIQSVKQRHGNNFDPRQIVFLMLGNKYDSPQEAWYQMLQSGRISQEQYNKYMKNI